MLCHYPLSRFVPTLKNRRRYHIDWEIKVTLRSIIDKKKQAMKNEDLRKDGDLLSLLLQLTEETGKR